MELYAQRHSLAHILAQAIQRTIDPAVQLGTGPAVDNGFYYDMLFTEGKDFGESQIKDLEKSMEGILKEGQEFGSYTANDINDAKALIKEMQQDFKIELVDKFFAQNKDAVYTFWYNYVDAQMLPRLEKMTDPAYTQYYTDITTYLSKKDPSIEGKFITFIDLCEGGHCETTKDIDPKSFKLDKIAGAYRQAKEGNPMMTRIYGIAFEDKNKLKEYQAMMAEAKKRDHRILGKKLNLFSFSDMVGAGFPLLQPNGMVIRQEIEKYLRELHQDKGYDRVRSPHLAKTELYKCSGHYEHYKENFQVKGKEEDFMVKPMNCPHHMQIFSANQFSYRDMPVRYFEPATVYRDEKSGQLSGLTRVRAITQDDGHLFCRASQITQEVSTIVDIIHRFYKTMDMIDNYWVSLSVRGEGEKYLGSDDVWTQAEQALQKAADQNKLPYKRMEGEAAFYGPKLDFMFKDAIGREWQLATIQCDFNLPERFDLHFTNEEGEAERPVVIHRAISGSLERFMGVMIEHYAGAFPVRLAPTQIQIIPVAEKFLDYAQSIQQKLQEQKLRTKLDDSSDSFSKKIRNSELMKVPYTVIVGEKEETDSTVSIRVFKTKKQDTLSVEKFIEQISNEYKERK